LTKSSPRTEPRATELFQAIAAEYLGRPGVSVGRIFHNEGLTINGKLFAMVVRGRLVVKVPAAQATTLIAEGRGVAFEPSPGRRLREWVMVEPPEEGDDEDGWPALVDDAHRYVAAPPPAAPRPPRQKGAP
jgi:hypothetical protein